MTRITTEAYRDGMRAAGDHFTARRMTRRQAVAIAATLPVREGDAYLAGYYAELRRLNVAADLEPDVRAARAKAVNGVWHCPTCGKANLIEEHECFDCKSEEQDPAADKGDWQFHQEHDQ